jgi:tetratricopeptide (TPR) repeat protein
MEEAAQGAPSTELRGHIESLRKAKRWEELSLPDDDPKSVVKRLVIDTVVADFDTALAAKYYASDERALFDVEANRGDRNVGRVSMLNLARDQGLPLAFYADIGMGNIQIVEDGDDEIGHRLRMRNSSGGSVTNDTLFVIKDNGQYRISATRKSPALIGFSVLRLLDAGKKDAARQWLNWAREEFPQNGGDDPLATTPFSRYWPKVKPAATDDEIRIGAAMLMLSKELSTRSIGILESAREKAATDEERLKLDHALTIAYALKDEEGAEMIAPAQRLAAAVPDSATAFNLLTNAFTRVDRHAEAAKLAQARLERIPGDEDALRVLGGSAMYTGDYAACDKYYRQIVTEHQPNAGDYNNIAWNALLSGKELERALEDARQAMQLPGGSAALLHTLASLYAETGKSLEAREALLQSMDSAGRDEPASHDWYVLGRIAENYGVTDAALAAYRKVEKPKTTPAASTYLLAERRMKVIAKK